MTLQRAPTPQDPGQGSVHFWLMQALLLGHSALMLHSGRQLGGDPIYVGKQEQDGEPLILRHSAFCPQGDGTQGSRCSSCAITGGAKGISSSLKPLLLQKIKRESYVVELGSIW